MALGSASAAAREGNASGPQAPAEELEGLTRLLDEQTRSLDEQIRSLEEHLRSSDEDIRSLDEAVAAARLAAKGARTSSGAVGSSLVRRAFATRFGEVIQYLAGSADEETLASALAHADPFSGLALALEHAVSLQPPRDPLAAARARGVAGRDQLVRRAGGLLRVGEVAEILSVTPQAIQGRRSRGTILAVPLPNGEWRYPACQFVDGRLLPALGTVLSFFKDVDPWQQLAVLLAPSARFGGQSALDLLASGEVDAAQAIAATYGEQG